MIGVHMVSIVKYTHASLQELRFVIWVHVVCLYDFMQFVCLLEPHLVYTYSTGIVSANE